MRTLRTLLFPLALVAALAASAAAQVTHTVQVNATSFSPKNITINLGDTIVWNMANQQFHDVTSGAGGNPDGNFDSGILQGPIVMLSITFDSAWVTSHPMPNQLYPYFCGVHLPGMTGSVKVLAPAALTPYGCGINPAGSLSLVSGLPRPGQSFVLSAHNPLATQSPSSFAYLALSLAPAIGYPCGIPLPGFGFSGGNGELLIDIGPGMLLSPLVGPALWNNAPANLTVNVPPSSTLVGLYVFSQGVIFDPSPGATVPLGLTSAMRVTIGT